MFVVMMSMMTNILVIVFSCEITNAYHKVYHKNIEFFCLKVQKSFRLIIKCTSDLDYNSTYHNANVDCTFCNQVVPFMA